MILSREQLLRCVEVPLQGISGWAQFEIEAAKNPGKN